MQPSFTCETRTINSNIEQNITFYEKLGMKKSEDVMQYNKIEWTEFTVK